MDFREQKPSQFELFSYSHDSNQGDVKSAFSLRELTLSIENIIVMLIIFIMGGVLFYSLGVEKGRQIKSEHLAATENITDKTQESAIIIHPVDENGRLKEIADLTPSDEIEVAEEKIEVISIPQIQELNDEPAELSIESPFTIQVASFKLNKNAKIEAVKLEKKGFEVSIIRKGNYSIVCVGKFRQASEAKTFTRKLKKKYKDCLVRRI